MGVGGGVVLMENPGATPGGGEVSSERTELDSPGFGAVELRVRLWLFPSLCACTWAPRERKLMTRKNATLAMR